MSECAICNGESCATCMVRDVTPNEPGWLQKALDSNQRAIDKWSDAKCEAAGIPRTDEDRARIAQRDRSAFEEFTKTWPEEHWDTWQAALRYARGEK